MEDHERKEIYERIGAIAHSASSPMTFSELGEKLGIDTTGRGVANRVSAAYDYFQDQGDESTAAKISAVFTNQSGSYSY